MFLTRSSTRSKQEGRLARQCRAQPSPLLTALSPALSTARARHGGRPEQRGPRQGGRPGLGGAGERVAGAG